MYLSKGNKVDFTILIKHKSFVFFLRKISTVIDIFMSWDCWFKNSYFLHEFTQSFNIYYGLTKLDIVVRAADTVASKREGRNIFSYEA